MKTINRLAEKPTHFREDISPEELENLPTFRRLFLNQLGGSQGENGEEAIEMYQLGLKIRSATESVDLEDAQFKILKKVCEKNKIQWLSHFHAQVLLLLKESEK